MRNLTFYGTDTGSLVINGVSFCNNAGDGCFNLFFAKKNELNRNEWNMIEEVWFDLRAGDIIVYLEGAGDEGSQYKIYDINDLDCEAVRLLRNKKGDFCLEEYF